MMLVYLSYNRVSLVLTHMYLIIYALSFVECVCYIFIAIFDRICLTLGYICLIITAYFMCITMRVESLDLSAAIRR